MSSGTQPQQRAMERRQLTVVFCDLVGSTALSQRLDAEELADIIASYQEAVTHCIVKYEGTVARYIGDGVLAYFGYPFAQENAAEYAIRASLAAITAVNELSTANERLSAHIGIASGDVVIGNLRWSTPVGLNSTDIPKEVSAVGETPNLAAALEKLAGPDMVVISSHTRRLAGKLFRYRDIGRHAVKGFDEPVPAWQVLSERRVPSRFRALRAVSRTPLVGRETELDKLKALWDMAREGRGQAVLLSGEAGVGKSRLVESVVRRTIGEDSLQYWYHCAPHSHSSALAPLIAQLRQTMDLTGSESDPVKLRKLASALSPSAQQIDDVVPLFADLLSIDYSSAYPLMTMSSQRRRQRLFESVLSMLRLLARKQPVTIVIEDLQWIDPSSQELIDMFVDTIRTLPVFLIMTARQEYVPQWSGRTNFNQIFLSPLDREFCQEIIKALLGERVAPQQVINQIIDRTDGIPLYVEDLTHHVIESLDRQGTKDSKYVHGNGATAVSVPATLQDTLMSRLDRLGQTALRVAQVASVFGREFSYPMVAETSEMSYRALVEALDQLTRAQLIVKLRKHSVTSYSFKHALIRDTAYSSLLKKDRAVLHTRAAHLLSEKFPEVREQQPELIAYHYEAANDVELAVDYWLVAGKRSAKRSSFVEAIDQLQHALDLINASPESESLTKKEMAVYTALGGAQTGYRGFSAAAAGEAYNQALELADTHDSSEEYFSALSGAGSYYITRAEFGRCRELADECLARAERQAAIPPFVIGKRLLGGTQFLTGELSDAIDQLEQAVALYDEHTPSFQDSDMLYVQDHKSTALCYLALAYVVSGQLDRGLSAARASLEHSRRLRDLHTTNFSLTYLAAVHHLRRDTPETLEIAQESLDLALEQKFATWVGVSRMIVGEYQVFYGDHQRGLEEIKAGMQKHGTTEAIAYQPFGISLFAKALVRVGRYDDARTALERALGVVEQYGERWYLPELWRILGAIMLGKGGDDKAEYWLRRAIDLAGEQKALYWELRATTMLAHLYHKQGKDDLARELVSAVYTRFTEGHDSWHLRAAHQLLTDLGH